MRRPYRALALAVLLIPLASQADAQVGINDFVEVVGQVTNASRPVEKAVVIALNLSDFYTAQVTTSTDGAFRLPPLRAGAYRIIAAKNGFAPAIATILPTRHAHTLNLKMQREQSLTRTQRDEIWQLRSSLPKDVLRELDSIVGPASPPVAVAAEQRFAAEMTSIAGVGEDLSSQTLAETAVGVRSSVGRGWVFDFKGSIRNLEDGSNQPTPVSVSQSQGLVMELSSAPGQRYRIASTRSSWRPETESLHGATADLEAHNFEWGGRTAHVRVRYLAQENLFRDHLDSERIEVIGDKTFLQSNRGRLGVSVSLGQENFVAGTNAIAPLRTANVAASGEFAPVQSFIVHYGVQTRVAENAFEWAPQTAAEWRVNEHTSLIVGGLYKIDEQEPFAALPSVILRGEPSMQAPRYRYSVTFLTGRPEAQRFSATASVAEIDTLVRVLFDDRMEQLTDGLLLEPGDVRTDLTLAYSRNLGRWVALDVSASGGQAEGIDGGEKSYVIADLQSLYKPTRTSVDVSYRQIDQPDSVPSGIVAARERMNVTMGQALPLPFDVRLLVGIELARLQNEIEAGNTYHRRYVGGLAFGF